MATHSSVLAWRIPGMGEPGGLPSMGSHRVGHDWSNLAAAAELPVAYEAPRARKWEPRWADSGTPLACNVHILREECCHSNSKGRALRVPEESCPIIWVNAFKEDQSYGFFISYLWPPGLPRGLSGKESPYSAGDMEDMGSVPGSGRFPAEGNSNSLQSSCLGNPMGKGFWRAAVHGVTKESDTPERLSSAHWQLPGQLYATSLEPFLP